MLVHLIKSSFKHQLVVLTSLLILFIYIYIYIYLVTKWCLSFMRLILTTQIVLYFRQVPMYSLFHRRSLDSSHQPISTILCSVQTMIWRLFVISFKSISFPAHTSNCCGTGIQSGFGHKLHCWNNKTWIYRWFVSFSTHWGRVTYIYVSKLTIIGSDNGLSPGRRQAIIWTKDAI